MESIEKRSGHRLPEVRLSPNPHSAPLVAVSGAEGSGKTALCEIVAEQLADLGYEVTGSPRPSPPLARWQAYQAAVREDDPPFDLRTLAGLLSWDQQSIQLRTVLPALERGTAVVCERYVTDICVLGAYHGADPQWSAAWVAPLLQPSVAFVTDVAEAELRRRLSTRAPGSAGAGQAARVGRLRSLYRQAADRYGGILVDTTGDPDLTKKQVRAALARSLPATLPPEPVIGQPPRCEVAVLIGSNSDRDRLNESGLLGLLAELGLACEFSVISSDRQPEVLRRFCLDRRDSLRVVIAAAGGVPNLPVTVKSWLPHVVVVGVPLDPDPAYALASLTTPRDRPVVVVGWGVTGLRKAAYTARDVLRAGSHHDPVDESG